MGQTSVTLLKERCIGCTTCVKRCPTEAIRVRGGRAHILTDYCIDCGMCMRVCRQEAKVAESTGLDGILNSAYKLKIALAPPSFYSQFEKNRSVNRLLTALKKLGFDDVFGVALGAELITKETIRFLKENPPSGEPWISSACPAVVRLIENRFPSLIERILPLISPMEATARMARKYYTEHGYSDEEIGVFFISPCPAKRTAVQSPQMIERSAVTDTVSMQEVYYRIRPELSKITDDEVEALQLEGKEGIAWAHIGGETAGVGIADSLAVDGIENVIDVLDDLENGNIEAIDFLEANCCTGGCLGGPLTIENSFNAYTRMKKVLRHNERKHKVRSAPEAKTLMDIPVRAEKALEPVASMQLDDDMETAFQMMQARDELFERLPKIDCGACGAPTCYAFAADVVRGMQQMEDCIILLRKKG